MIDNKILKEKLKSELNKLDISGEEKEELVNELNYLSDLFIKIYFEKNINYGTKPK